MKKTREFILKMFQLLMRPEMRILPGQLAFFLVLTIIPMVALIITIAAALSLSAEAISVAIQQTLPTQIAAIIETIKVGDGMSLNLFVFLPAAPFHPPNSILCFTYFSNSNM